MGAQRSKSVPLVRVLAKQIPVGEPLLGRVIPVGLDSVELIEQLLLRVLPSGPATGESDGFFAQGAVVAICQHGGDPVADCRVLALQERGEFQRPLGTQRMDADLLSSA